MCSVKSCQGGTFFCTTTTTDGTAWNNDEQTTVARHQVTENLGTTFVAQVQTFLNEANRWVQLLHYEDTGAAGTVGTKQLPMLQVPRWRAPNEVLPTSVVLLYVPRLASRSTAPCSASHSSDERSRSDQPDRQVQQANSGWRTLPQLLLDHHATDDHLQFCVGWVDVDPGQQMWPCVNVILVPLQWGPVFGTGNSGSQRQRGQFPLGSP